MVSQYIRGANSREACVYRPRRCFHHITATNLVWKRCHIEVLNLIIHQGHYTIICDHNHPHRHHYYYSSGRVRWCQLTVEWWKGGILIITGRWGRASISRVSWVGKIKGIEWLLIKSYGFLFKREAFLEYIDSIHWLLGIISHHQYVVKKIGEKGHLTPQWADFALEEKPLWGSQWKI